jgi:hypothetical protein
MNPVHVGAEKSTRSAVEDDRPFGMVIVADFILEFKEERGVFTSGAKKN